MDKSINKKIVIGLVIAFLFITMKLIFLIVDDPFFLFLIYPVKVMLELQSSVKGVLVDGSSYYFSELNIIIDRSCSGANFLIISFLMILYYAQLHLQKNRLKLLALPVSLVGAYLFTLLVNTSRIFISLYLNQTFLGNIHWLHEVEGAFIYLSFFIILFQSIKLLENKIVKQYA